MRRVFGYVRWDRPPATSGPRSFEKCGVEFGTGQSFEDETTRLDHPGAVSPQKDQRAVFGFEVERQHLLEGGRHVCRRGQWYLPRLRIIGNDRRRTRIEHDFGTEHEWRQFTFERERSLIESFEVDAFGCQRFDHQLLGRLKESRRTRMPPAG